LKVDYRDQKLKQILILIYVQYYHSLTSMNLHWIMQWVLSSFFKKWCSEGS